MVGETPSGTSTAENPIIREILAKGGARATVLWGYIGPSTREGFITLHPSLRNLSVTMEIAERDIIHVADIPESIFPFDAKAIWIRNDAQISHRVEESSNLVRSHRVEDSVGTVSDPSTGPGVVEVTRGRLRMRMTDLRRGSDCHSPCATCHCPCSVCVSICQVKL
jgi:hypothetical protein